MGSRKGSAKAKRIAEFKAGLGGMDDVFARESVRKSKKLPRKTLHLEKKLVNRKIDTLAKVMPNQLLSPALSMGPWVFIAISVLIATDGILPQNQRDKAWYCSFK